MPTAAVILEDCRIPKENLIGEEGEGVFCCILSFFSVYTFVFTFSKGLNSR